MSSKGRGKLCPKCFTDSAELGKGMSPHVKEDMKGFSDKIGELLRKNNNAEQAHKKK